MEKTLKDLLREEGLDPNPVYSEEELREIAQLLHESGDPMAEKIYRLLDSFGFMPELFEDWTPDTNDEYDYHGLFYGSQDNLLLAVGSQDDFDVTEEIVYKWRMDHNK